jgi:hypothetical protein
VDVCDFADDALDEDVRELDEGSLPVGVVITLPL